MVTSLEVEGLEKTDRDVMQRYFSPVFHAKRLSDMIKALETGTRHCQALQIFKDVTFEVIPGTADFDDDRVMETGTFDVDDVDGLLRPVVTPVAVIIKVQERKGRFFIGSEWLSSNDLVAVPSWTVVNVPPGTFMLAFVFRVESHC